MPSSQMVVLNPGDFHFTDHGHISTLLGSCVAITLWHPRLRVGGMCHYVVPSRGLRSPEPSGRYGDEAMMLFLRELDHHGTRPGEYQVQMFGGGTQFPYRAGGALDVASNNIVAGRRLLDHHGFALTTWHVGGTGSRRVTLEVPSGAVQLSHTHQNAVGEPV